MKLLEAKQIVNEFMGFGKKRSNISFDIDLLVSKYNFKHTDGTEYEKCYKCNEEDDVCFMKCMISTTQQGIRELNNLLNRNDIDNDHREWIRESISNLNAYLGRANSILKRNLSRVK